MARISIGSANFFSKEAYQRYLEGRNKGYTIDYLSYAFMFRALSKEAIMALAENLLY